MAALVLTMVTLGPSLDILICKDEGGRSVAAAKFTLAAVQDAEPSDTSHERDGLETCVHGHCHHATPYLPAATVVTDGTTAQGERHRAEADDVPTSDHQFGLKRPPRA